MAKATGQADVKEPSILVRPIRQMGGLDNIHIVLLVLVVILIALVVVISYSKPVVIKNETSYSLNCTYSLNGACVTPVHNATGIKTIVARELANYQYINSSLAQLAYLSNVSGMNVTYIPAAKEWYATVPVQNPSSGGTFLLSFIINDSTGTVESVLAQTVMPPMQSSDYVVAQGVIKIAKVPVCSVQQPLHVQWFLDPYAPGAVQSLLNYTGLQRKYAGELNTSINIIFSQYTSAYINTSGASNAEALGKYIYCASKQQNFGQFATTLNSAFTNTYMSPNDINAIAASSGLDIAGLNECVNTSSTALGAQILLGQRYGIIETPSVVTDCEYLSTPATAQSAICYSNSTMC